jgi:serine/threonine-protein kinase
MAEILLAVELTPNTGHRFVTIKRIKPEFSGEADYNEFFLTEGRVSLKCSHPNLPQVYELGVEAGSHFLAMEYIQGHTLLDVIRAAALKDRPLAVGTALRVGVGVAAALEHAHGLVDVDGTPLGIIHRDVTPQNIMITAGGAVKLIDFGIVRAAVQTHETQVGVVKGKFSYMAPEMLRGTPKSIDHRADLFALGIVLHETLTGRSLFRGKTDEDTLRRVRSLPVPSLSALRADVPASFDAVVQRALERDPARRFQSATELLHALESAAELEGIHASMTRLRDEALDRCGASQPLTLEPTARAMLAQPADPAAIGRLGSAPPVAESAPAIPLEPEDLWEADGATEAEPDAEARAQQMALSEADTRLGLRLDPELIYYLRQAGALPTGPRTSASTHADHELSELLASLDR